MIKSKINKNNLYKKKSKKKCLNPKTENISIFKQICINNKILAEPKFYGKYTNEPYVSGKINGIYICPCCKNILYSSKHAFSSNTGWPAFSNTFNKKTSIIYNKKTKELICKKCKLHLGHRFINKHKIHDCINSVCLHFIPIK